MLKGFLRKHPAMQKAPFFVFAESYGGKMASNFGVRLDQAIQRGEINCTFKGVALGDSWVSPLDAVESYGAYLQALSHLDPHEREQADRYAAQIADALQSGRVSLFLFLFCKAYTIMICYVKVHVCISDTCSFANWNSMRQRQACGLSSNATLLTTLVVSISITS